MKTVKVMRMNKNEQEPKRLALPLRDAAKAMGLSRSQLAYLCRTNCIKAVRLLRPGARRALWLIPMAELERLLGERSLG